MNPNLIWDEVQAKMADNHRVADHRHLEGEAKKVCRLCGAINAEHAVACGTCGRKLKLSNLKLDKLKLDKLKLDRLKLDRLKLDRLKLDKLKLDKLKRGKH